MNMGMKSINESMLALILRFIGVDVENAALNKEFVKKETDDLNTYLQNFPENERDSRAIEWVSRYAVSYREEWEKKLIVEHFTDAQCPDCPLKRTREGHHCHIHDQWRVLLNQFSAGEVSSQEYVRQTLGLLSVNKEALRMPIRI